MPGKGEEMFLRFIFDRFFFKFIIGLSGEENDADRLKHKKRGRKKGDLVL